MTPSPKETLETLVELTEKNPGDMLEALRDHEQFKALELIKALRGSIPALKSLLKQLEAAEDIVDRSLAHFPEKKLRALAHGYRLQYPKASLEKP